MGSDGATAPTDTTSWTRSATRTKTRTRTGTEREVDTGEDTDAETETETRPPAETGPIATIDGAYLWSYEYREPERLLRVTLYNPTEAPIDYDLIPVLRDETGFKIWAETIDGGEVESDDTYRFEIRVPAFLADQVEYHSFYVAQDDYDYVELYTEPSTPPRRQPWAVDESEFLSSESIEFKKRVVRQSPGEPDVIGVEATNTADRTVLFDPVLTLESDGGVTLDSAEGRVFPLRSGEAAVFQSEVFAGDDYILADVATYRLSLARVVPARLPPTTDAFEEIGRDIIQDTLRFELRNTTETTVAPATVTRWFHEDRLMDVEVEYSDFSIDPGERTTLKVSPDLTDVGDRYAVSIYHTGTLIELYADVDDDGTPWTGVVPPFGIIRDGFIRGRWDLPIDRSRSATTSRAVSGTPLDTHVRSQRI
jgi:hypothetical protein